MSIREISVAVAAALILGLAQPAAGDCPHDLADANRLIDAVQHREAGIDDAVAKHDMARACRLLRHNQRDMIVARDSMDRCLTGFDRRENVGQMDDSLGDLHDVLTTHCQ